MFLLFCAMSLLIGGSCFGFPDPVLTGGRASKVLVPRYAINLQRSRILSPGDIDASCRFEAVSHCNYLPCDVIYCGTDRGSAQVRP